MQSQGAVNLLTHYTNYPDQTPVKFSTQLSEIPFPPTIAQLIKTCPYLLKTYDRLNTTHFVVLLELP